MKSLLDRIAKVSRGEEKLPSFVNTCQGWSKVWGVANSTARENLRAGIKVGLVRREKRKCCTSYNSRAQRMEVYVDVEAEAREKNRKPSKNSSLLSNKK